MHSLQLQLCGHRLKWTKKERRFLFERLQLLDRQFYLQQIRCLYQLYFEQGAKYHTWLVSCESMKCFCLVEVYTDVVVLICSCFFEDDIVKIVQSKEPKIIQTYLEEYLILLQNRMNQYTVELTTQSLSCPAVLLANTNMSFEMLDRRLNDFVRLHHLDLISWIQLIIA